MINQLKEFAIKHEKATDWFNQWEWFLLLISLNKYIDCMDKPRSSQLWRAEKQIKNPSTFKCKLLVASFICLNKENQVEGFQLDYSKVDQLTYRMSLLTVYGTSPGSFLLKLHPYCNWKKIIIKTDRGINQHIYETTIPCNRGLGNIILKCTITSKNNPWSEQWQRTTMVLTWHIDDCALNYIRIDICIRWWLEVKSFASQ